MHDPPLILQKINPEQRAAGTAVDGPSLVIAGPGSGKTRTLTVKALYILRHHPEARILCVTHTRKAADEMRARIVRHGNIASIQVSTIHSLCYRILKKSLGEPIRILSDYDHGVIVRLAAQTTGVETDQRQATTAISHAKLGLSNLPQVPGGDADHQLHRPTGSGSKDPQAFRSMGRVPSPAG